MVPGTFYSAGGIILAGPAASLASAGYVSLEAAGGQLLANASIAAYTAQSSPVLMAGIVGGVDAALQSNGDPGAILMGAALPAAQTRILTMPGLPPAPRGTNEQSPILDASFWARQRIPTRISPTGRTEINEIFKPSTRGAAPYRKLAEYDNFGRLRKITDFSDHNEQNIHPNPHYHLFDFFGNRVVNPENGSLIFQGD